MFKLIIKSFAVSLIMSIGLLLITYTFLCFLAWEFIPLSFFASPEMMRVFLVLFFLWFVVSYNSFKSKQ